MGFAAASAFKSAGFPDTGNAPGAALIAAGLRQGPGPGQGPGRVGAGGTPQGGTGFLSVPVPPGAGAGAGAGAAGSLRLSAQGAAGLPTPHTLLGQ